MGFILTTEGKDRFPEEKAIFKPLIKKPCMIEFLAFSDSLYIYVCICVSIYICISVHIYICIYIIYMGTDPCIYTFFSVCVKNVDQ